MRIKVQRVLLDHGQQQSHQESPADSYFNGLATSRKTKSLGFHLKGIVNEKIFDITI